MKTKLSIDAGEFVKAFSFIVTGHDKSGTHLDTQMLHMEMISGQVKDQTRRYLALTTRNRYVVARYAIPLSEASLHGDYEEIGFKAIVDYEKFSNYIKTCAATDTLQITWDDTKDVISVKDGSGWYRFTNNDLEFNIAQPKTHPLAKLPFEAFTALAQQSRGFTSSDASQIQASSIRLMYDKDKDPKHIVALIYNNQTAARFSYPIEGDDVKPFDVYLRANLIRKISEQPGVLILTGTEDNDVFGLRTSNGHMTIATLNDVEDSSVMIQTLLSQERPYHFEMSRDDLTRLTNKLSLFAGDSIIAEVKNDKMVAKARSARGVDAAETIACSHLGELNMELPIKVLRSILGVDDSTTQLRFEVDKEGNSALIKGNGKGLGFQILFSIKGYEE